MLLHVILSSRMQFFIHSERSNSIHLPLKRALCGLFKLHTLQLTLLHQVDEQGEYKQQQRQRHNERCRIGKVFIVDDGDLEDHQQCLDEQRNEDGDGEVYKRFDIEPLFDLPRFGKDFLLDDRLSQIKDGKPERQGDDRFEDNIQRE